MATSTSRNPGSSEKPCRSPTPACSRAATSGGSDAARRSISATMSGERSMAQTSAPSRARGIATRPAAAPRSSTGDPSRAAAARQNGRSSV